MKVLISGGTGFIGEAIAKKLIQKGHTVRILSRNLEKAEESFKNTALEISQGDITQPQTLPSALKEIEVVIQCAQFPGHPVENPRKGYTYWQVDALGTENLAKAAKQAGVKHFIYISGAGTDGKKQEPWFKAKWYAEQAVRSSGILATILRPSMVYGPGDKSLNRIINLIRKSLAVPILGSGKNHLQPIFVEDLANIVTACLSYEGPHDRTLEVGGPEEMTMKKLIKTVLKILGKRRLLIPIPKILMKLGAFPLQFLPTPPLSPKAVDFLTMDIHIDLTPFQKTFPQIQLKTFEEGLKSYL